MRVRRAQARLRGRPPSFLTTLSSLLSPKTPKDNFAPNLL